jgi:DNA N-6-adenine-methyltransferase (Dam)
VRTLEDGAGAAVREGITELPTGALSKDDARSLTDEVKADAAALWTKLLALYEGQAHVALGYSSWSDYCAAEFDMGKSHAYRLLDAGRVVAVLEAHSPNGGTPASERVARELIPLLDEDEAAVLEVWRELREEHGDKLTAEKVREAVGERLASDNRFGDLKPSNSVEWYTPARYVEAARKVLGGIDLDPASSEYANETVRADVFHTVADDGLSKLWRGRVWMNPPYGARICGDFVTKLLGHYGTGDVTAAVVLLNGFSFDASWFRPLWDEALCFTYGRIPFTSPVRQGGGPATGSVFAYLGPDWPGFAEVFGQFGAVVTRLATE